MMTKHYCLVLAVLCVGICLSQQPTQQPFISGIPVNVGIVASWNETPISLEASEFFAKEEGEAGFWAFVSTYSVSETETAKEQFETLVNCASKLLPSSKLSILKLSLASRVYSPAVEFQRQLFPSSLAASSLKTFAIFNGVVYSSVSDLSNALTQQNEQQHGSVADVPDVIDGVDHVLGNKSASKTVFLYGHFGTESFSLMNNLISKKVSEDSSLKYVLRHSWTNGNGIIGSLNMSKPISLKGFGVEFALKSVEYKTIDEPTAEEKLKQQQEKPQENAIEEGKAIENQENEENGLLEKSDEFDRLSKSELNGLSIHAVNHIVFSNNPLKALKKLSHEFPAFAAALSRSEIEGKDDFNSNFSVMWRQIEENSRHFGTGTNRILVNGKVVDRPHDNWFDLLNLISSEISRVELLREFGMSSFDSSKILSDYQSSNNKNKNQNYFQNNQEIDEKQLVFDINSPNIVWINDLEKERFYGRFGQSVNDLLRPTWPGNLRYVAKNLYSIVIIADPENKKALELLSNFGYFIAQMLPMRIGVVLVPLSSSSSLLEQKMECNSDNGECLMQDSISLLIAKTFYGLKHKVSPRVAMSLFGQLSDSIGESPKITLEMLKNAFESTAGSSGMGSGIGSFEDIISMPEVSESIKSSIDYTREAGLTISTQPLVFVNGVPVSDISHAGQLIGTANAEHTPILQSLIRKQLITDETEDIYSTLLAIRGALPKFSPYAVPNSAIPIRYTSLLVPKTSSENQALVSAKYISPSVYENKIKSVSHIICVDLETPDGKRLISEALNSFVLSQASELLNVTSRIAIFDGSDDNSQSSTWKKIYSIIQDDYSGDKTLEKIKSILKNEDSDIKFSTQHFETIQNLQREFCSAMALKVQEDGNVARSHLIISNGRIIAPKKDEEFSSYDFSLLALSESRRTLSVIEQVDKAELTGYDPDTNVVSLRSEILMRVVSQLGVSELSGEVSMPVSTEIVPTFKVGTNEKESLVIIDALLDPLSREAQRFVPMLEALIESLPINLRVYLNPQQKPETLPLKLFYHFSLDTNLKFDDKTGELIVKEMTPVEKLPANRLLTLGMDVPHPWIVMAAEAKLDLDNLRLGEAAAAGDSSVHALFRLEDILVEGNCHDSSTQIPPRGLELDLSRKDSQQHSDTIVMSNFGYFQLKSSPGMWYLSLREGRSTLLYSITDIKTNSLPVVINNLLGKTIELQVTKNPGHESDPLLVVEEDEKKEEESKNNNLWSKIFGTPSRDDDKEEEEKNAESMKQKNNNTGDDEKINVFSIASGHLYERFVKIMMASIVRKASVPVKFWFIKNYLSPAFKEAIEGLSKKYNFEYELVTYKWPSWLHPQTEKQRLIWGYKVLFLDVLFPINLKKVIYVDADQVVRGDLKELMDMNLNGAPIAMTPFCSGPNERKETAGYKFWTSGYWAEHLRGKPYHISALFVVDLKKFRRLAAGDQYRAHYDGLARDPNSLSNLDQDLPNYLQHVVPIYSLPSEWLWCETWCNDASKIKAKTIDLCNNPMTKVPKLDSAQRIIEEWNTLDSDVRKTEEEIHSNKQKQQQE